MTASGDARSGQAQPRTAPLRVNVSGPQGSGKSTLAGRLSAERSLSVAETALGAASYETSLIVTDVRNGFDTEARRHTAIACTMGARHLVLAVNKLDLLGWDQPAYEAIAKAFGDFAAQFKLASAIALPLSALQGCNIAARGTNLPWYEGPTLLSHLVTIARDRDASIRPLRLPIASVSRPDPDHRLYAGTIASGTLRRGDTVQVAVSGVTSIIERILRDGAECAEATAGEAVAIRLADHIDVARGDHLVHPEQRPQIAEQFAAHLVWLAAEPLLPGRDYTLRMGTREVTASITALKYRLDVETLHHDAARTLARYDIGACTIAAAAPLAIDAFADFPQTGAFVLTERHGDAVIAAGTVDFALRRGINIHVQPLNVSKRARAKLKGQAPCIVWFTGLSGAGKSTLANFVEGTLAAGGYHTYLLDGDNVRHALNKDLGFTDADRVENIRRVGEVAKLFVNSGLIVLCSFISPFRAERAAVRGLVEAAEFIEVYVKAPLDVCESRDPKGLYAKSRAGSLPNFTGVDSPYEAPESPDLVLDTTSATPAELAGRVTALLQARGIVAPLEHKRP